MPEITIDLALWNVHVGQSPDVAMKRIRRIARLRSDEVIAANEASRLAGRLDEVPGYRGFQLPRRANRRGVVSEDASTGALIDRSELEVLAHQVIRMGVRWSFRKPHDPRVYHAFRLRHRESDQKFRLAVVHYPPGGPNGRNAKAWRESARRMNRWLKMSTLPSIILGDLNGTKATVMDHHPAASTVAGSGVDLAIGRRVKALRLIEVLAKGLSDHTPKRIRARLGG